MSSGQLEMSPLASGLFREVIGHFATGVTVITAFHEDIRYGTTASAVSSVSLEPPMLLICMNEQSSTGQAVATSGRFAVNVTSARARRTPRPDSEGKAWTSSEAWPSGWDSAPSRC